MSVSLSCFKAYDVRGKVPADLNTTIAFCIGKAFAEEFSAHNVVTGYDARLSGPGLQKALIAGLEAGGARVTSIGLCATEEIYFASTLSDSTGHLHFDGGIMITGSHNPADENGLKFVRGGAIPISGDSGLFRIRERVKQLLQGQGSERTEEQAIAPTNEENTSFRKQYLDFVCERSGLEHSRKRPLHLHIDPGNGCAGLLARELCERAGFFWSGSNMEPNGNFPNGIPNPLLPEKRAMTAQSVRDSNADMGIAWDGDADRCFFYDEDGNFIEGYYLVGLLAESMLQQYPGSRIIHDPRLYWNTRDIVLKKGGIPVQSKTGHAFIKERMRTEDAVYGGEMSSHHYFRDFAYCDSGMFPWLLVAKLVAEGSQTLGEKVHDRMKLYPCSGEINSRVDDPASIQKKVREKYAPKAFKEEHVDGLSMEFKDWRFNLRSSNTEPLLRLNVESRGDTALMEDKTSELILLIRS